MEHKETTPRILLVANRLPSTFRFQGEQIKILPSGGGLATGLRTPHERSGGLWFGWPGDVRRLSPEHRASLDAELAARRLVPVHLTASQVDRFYLGYSNGVLWPLFHYLLDRLPRENDDWEEYEQVNERFAETVAGQYRAGDIVWIHDYQLLLVPRFLRQKLPDARIGFFLHIPFPSSEVFRILPKRAELLQGMLGADLIGFHTPTYMRHFSMSLLRILGLEVDVDRVWHEGREIRLGAYPMGIDADSFDALARDPEVRREAEELRQESGGARIILAVDRLDYSKGLPRRLAAFSRLLEREPALRGKVRLIQVAVPSRTELKAYEEYKRGVDELVGRINGKFGTARHVPIHYLNTGFTQRQLASFYCAADVMAVTPLRDGLNLVAKEYIASRVEGDGVLVLSELAGAATELSEALLVNPYDVDGVAGAFSTALKMDRAEQVRRLAPLRSRVATYNVHRWVATFLEDLETFTLPRTREHIFPTSSVARAELLARMRQAERLILFLDYDGTLVPLVARPEAAAPDPELLRLLTLLASRPGVSLHLLSGRRREDMEEWLGSLPATLHAEHGLCSRSPGSDTWMQNLTSSDAWKSRVRPILEEFVKTTPRSMIEEKTAGLVWHYRNAEQAFAVGQAKELRLLLIELLSNVPVQVIPGNKVVEVRVQGADKGNIVARILGAETDPVLPVAFGDDRTDEDMFSALPAGGVAVHVGYGESSAQYRLPEPSAVRSFLAGIVAGAEG